jgi:hypothetical protein
VPCCPTKNWTNHPRSFSLGCPTTVLATDICDRELGALRKARWATAFSDEPVDSTPEMDVDRKATIVIEHLIQVGGYPCDTLVESVSGSIYIKILTDFSAISNRRVMSRIPCSTGKFISTGTNGGFRAVTNRNAFFSV